METMDSDIICPNEITEDTRCPGQKDGTCHQGTGGGGRGGAGALIRRGGNWRVCSSTWNPADVT